MKLLIILVLMWFVWAAWVWPKQPGWKLTKARTWLAGRGKTGLKSRHASRL